jgi:hypothetical protein
MTGPIGDVLERLSGAVKRGMSGPGRRAPRGSDTARRALEDVGLLGVGLSSTDEEIAEWDKRLWHDQDGLFEELQREWRQHLHYVANEQAIAYHRDKRMWIQRPALTRRSPRSLIEPTSQSALLQRPGRAVLRRGRTLPQVPGTVSPRRRSSTGPR